MIRQQHNNYHYKVTVNHVTLSSMGKIFDLFNEHLKFEHFVMGFELPRIGTPHYQIYLGGTPYTQFDQIRKIMTAALKALIAEGAIDCPSATVVAFPVEIDIDHPLTSEDHLIRYCKKDGIYLHRFFDGEDYVVQCGANDLIGTWYHVADFSANHHFKHFLENGKLMPTVMSHRKVYDFNSKIL